MGRLLIAGLFSMMYLAGCAHHSVQAQLVQVCYLPFDYETYGPVTRESIEKYKCQEFDKANATSKNLLSHLGRDAQEPGSDNPQFEEKRVRLEVNDRTAAPIFVDAEGVVSDGEKTYKLTAQNKLEIGKSLGSVFEYED